MYTSVASVAGTVVAIDVISAGAIEIARNRRAFIDVDFTVNSCTYQTKKVFKTSQLAAAD